MPEDTRPQEPTRHQEKSASEFEEISGSSIKTLLSWSAPGRPYKKKHKEFYLSILLIVTFLEIILFLFSEYTLMFVVLSLAFVVYVLSSTPPKNFHYKLSTQGITIEDHFFLWDELYDFYFNKKNGIDILHIRTHAFIPGELTLTLGNIDKEHLKSVLVQFLPYREIIRKTFMEKSGDWLSDNFPLERVEVKKDHASHQS